MKLTKLLLPWIVILLSVQARSQKKDFNPAIRAAQDSVRAFLTAHKVPGAAVSVAVNGKTVWSKGFGYADLEQKVMVDPGKTKFRIASISKPITATGLALLYEKGKIQLDSSIYFYLPNYPVKKYRPTIRQLAGHLAGTRWYRGEEFFSAKRYMSVTEGLIIFQNDSLLSQPGTKYNYSSYGFNLLSAAMEKVSGKNFLAFMNEQVIKPLQMNNTVADYNDSLITYRSRFYDISETRWVNSPFVDNSYKWAGGGFLSTSEDLIKFGNTYLQPGFLKKETIDLFTASQKSTNGSETGYGMGWGSRKDKNGKNWFGHSGGAVGGTSDLVIYPSEKIVVVILTNLSGAGIDDLGQTIATLFMN